LALDVTSEENEAIFISCTNLRAIEIIQLLEQETGKPVITSNQAAMWHALRRLGINDAIEGYGRLFSL
jgi:maleate cis-trans isomerase